MKKVLGVTGVDFNSSELFIFILYRYPGGTCPVLLLCRSEGVVPPINLVLHAHTHTCVRLNCSLCYCLLYH